MNKKLYLPLLLAVLVAFVGCKKMGGLKAEYFTVTPNPLEVVGGEVPATITGQFPEKYCNISTQFVKKLLEMTKLFLTNWVEILQ